MLLMLLALVKHILSMLRSIFDTCFTSLYLVIESSPEVDIQGKRALVTGSNVGIGKDVALSLASRGAEVFLLCRDENKAKAAQQHIIAKSGNNNVFIEVVDFSSLGSVKRLVERWNERPTKESRRVDILVNNAGLMMTTKATTVDGFETCYQVNMLGPFALTMSFLRNGFFSPTARIVQVSSAIIYRNINPLDPKDLNFKSMAEGTGGFLAGTLLGLYSSSKAQQVIFTRELQRRLSKFDQFKDVVVQSCHPGLVQSSIWDRSAILEKSKTLKLFMAILNHIYGIQCHVAALTPLFLTVSQKAAEPCMKGGFWERAHQKWVPYWMLDEALCDTLWRKWIEDAEVYDPLHDSAEDYHIDSGSRVSNGL